jgi:hypothetical protein
MSKIIEWLFNTPHGRIVLVLTLPLSLAFWAIASLIVGENFFEWLDERRG